MVKEQFSGRGIENHQEGLIFLESAKEKSIDLGLFERDLLEDLNYIVGDFKIKERSGKEIGLAELSRRGNIIDERFNEPDKLDNTKDVRIFSKPLLLFIEKVFDNLSPKIVEDLDLDDKHLVNHLFIGPNTIKLLYQFDAVVIHEIAHAKSYGAINEGKFNQQEFTDKIKDLIKENKINKCFGEINFNKFQFSQKEWSEIYALLYQREFLIRENFDNKAEIQKWDRDIFNTVNNLDDAIKGLNQKTGKSISPDMIYQENHTLSFLLSCLLEEKFKNFNERIKFLESFKK
ncbi:MAG: hypothetical protein COV26_02045 [Candidatus Nealsonbacteria bacterium CG10_big_fil_rev_8_21_14_0_10_36_23]|uniref:Uncharacterized protein n=1 Tax=Candidatus Nealsonbacteria bacterium CG10_big_fil_rev_8_21_14_0_10_36_23 TaxID=1974709 RepID=A0A2H0TKY2_9BACT|nr:MAG: hypothetical protein COV26_02045 [Candidatus Nealsonbacteria bacterium CG10_big_fil_rev_8_21_14_0_10_36_23]